MENLLILHPADPHSVPAVEPLIAALERIGFLGDPFDFNGRKHRRPGPEFLQRLTFLGCSPVVSLGEPGATGDEFCHVRLDIHREPVFVSGANLKPARCPACRARIPGWRELADAPDTEVVCPECGRRSTATELDWRQSAAYARMLLFVWGIFEGEAVPADRLMATLAEQGGKWCYGYVRR